MGSSTRPDWWSENQELKESLGLPEYVPPRFEDGRYTHEVIDDLESEYDCSITIIAINPRYPDNWEVRVEFNPIFEVGRRRDKMGNTVYELTSDEFRDQFEKNYYPNHHSSSE